MYSAQQTILYERKGSIFIRVLKVGGAIRAAHFDVIVRGGQGRRARVKPYGSVAVACHDSNLIGVIHSEVSIYEDDNIGYGFGEGEGGCEKRPGMRIGVEDYDEKGGRWRYEVVRTDAASDSRPHYVTNLKKQLHSVPIHPQRS